MLIVGKYFPEEISEWLRPSEVPNKKNVSRASAVFNKYFENILKKP